MPGTPVTLIKGDKVSIETDYRDALPVNMYSVMQPILGAQGYMLCYPGLTKFADGSGTDRGAVYNERLSEHFRVSGTKLIKVNAGNTITELGTIPGTGQVSMPYSFNTQCVIANDSMYLYDETAGFREVTDTDLGKPIDGVEVDQYYFLTDGEYLYHSDIDDEASFSGLSFATAEYSPDPTLGLALTQDNKVMVFGRYTIEYFQNAATQNFAFQRIATRAQKIGIVATHAKCESSNKWYIVGGRKEESVGVHVIASGASGKVSSREVDKIIAEYTEPELSNMRLECKTEDGTTLIIVHLPDITLCFNESISRSLGVDNAWFILKSDFSGDKTYRAINGIFDPNVSNWMYGDKSNHNIGILDNTVFTHYDELVEWLLYSPLLNLETMSINTLEIETIPGHTSTRDAKVAVSLTYDGLTYGREWFEMYGLPNDYGKRFILRRLGYVYDWVGFKFRGATRSRMAFGLMRIDHG